MGQERLSGAVVEIGDIVNYLQTFPGEIDFSQGLVDQVFEFDQERLRVQNIFLTSEQIAFRKEFLSESLKIGLPYRVAKKVRKEGKGTGLFLVSPQGEKFFYSYQKLSEKLGLDTSVLQKRLTVLVGPQPSCCGPNLFGVHKMTLFPLIVAEKIMAMCPKKEEKPFVEEISEEARRDIPVVVNQIRTSLSILPDQGWQSIKKEEQLKLWKLIEEGRKSKSSEEERIACLAAFEIIIEANIGLVKNIILEKFPNYIYSYFEAMFQYGKVGLANAAKEYKPYFGNTLPTYAYNSIIWEIKFFLRKEVFQWLRRGERQLRYLEERHLSSEGEYYWDELVFDFSSSERLTEEAALEDPFDPVKFFELLKQMGLEPAITRQRILDEIINGDIFKQGEIALSLGLKSPQLVSHHIVKMRKFLQQCSPEQWETILEQLRDSD